ncbi:DEK1, partial [Symbiodinium natans]
MAAGLPPSLPGDMSPFHPPMLLGRSLSHAIAASPMVPHGAPSSPSGLVHSTSHLMNLQSLVPSISHSQTSMFQPANFQFTFNAPEQVKSASPDIRPQQTEPLTPQATPTLSTTSGQAAAPSAPSAHCGLPHEGATPSQPSVRMRDAQHPALGVCQEPMSCDTQLMQCISACRRDVEAKAAERRAQGQKYVDPDFPADSRALWVNGISPSESLSSVMVSSWCRSEPSKPPGDPSESGVITPGVLGSFYLQGALAMMRSVGKDPNELIVHRDAEAGIYGVRFYKDGRWIYEILDDLLPVPEQGRALSSSCGGQEWPALIEKAYAKMHGCYEAAVAGAEEDAMEDLLGVGAGRFAVSDFPIWAELWQHLRSKRKRGFVLAAIRRREAAGEVLTSGLLSGCAYPVVALEVVNGHALVALENPWFQGRWNGRWGPDCPERGQLQLPGCQPFWMSIQDFCQHFTDIVQARLVPASWQSAMVAMSEERPSYPLVSVSSPTQAVFILSQIDHLRSKRRAVPLGLRVYRCRIVAPPQHATGVKQNVSNPFKPLELVAERPISQARSVMVEVPKLEPNCLYVASILFPPNASPTSPDLAVLRVLTASSMRFRELSLPESAYFLQAEEAAASRPLFAVDTDSFSSQ